MPANPSRPLAEAETSTYRSRELRLIVTAAMAVALATWLSLSLLDWHSDWLLLDLREWRLSASDAAVPNGSGTTSFRSFARRLQPPQAARQPFRLTLELPGPPEPGRFVAAERRFEVDRGAAYCFEVWTWNPGAEVEPAAAAETFRVSAGVDGGPIATLPLGEPGEGRRLALEGLRADDGELFIRLEVRSLARRTGEAWRRASRTHFDFASLRRCPGDS